MLRNALSVAAAGAAGEPSDEYFKNTTLLLKGDGNQGDIKFANADTPTYLAFSDESDNDFAITLNGEPYGSSFNPFLLRDGEWSVDLSGGAYCTFTGDSLTSLDGDFTFECWIYLKSYVGGSYNELTIFNNRSGSSTGTQIDIGNSVSGNPGACGIWHNGSSIANTGGTKVIQLNEWTHLAFVRYGTDTNNLKIYVNGVQVGQGTNTDTLFGSSGTFYIGNSIYNQPFNNIITNLRLTKGYARYTETFVPRLIPYDAAPPPAGSVSLLCFQNKGLTTNGQSESTATRTITGVNNPKISAFSPYRPSLSPTRIRYNIVAGAMQGAATRRYPWSNLIGHLGPVVEGYFLADLNMTGGGTSSDVTSSDALVYFKYLNNISITEAQLNRINILHNYILENAENGYDIFIHEGGGLEEPIIDTAALQQAVQDTTVRREPANTLIGIGGPQVNGYYLADITNNGDITSADSLAHLKWIAGTQTSQDYIDWIETVFHPYILANPDTYADYITTGGVDPLNYAFGSAYFDGSGDYATIADTTTLEPGTGPFRIECWVYHTTAASGITIYTTHTGSGFSFYRNASGKLAFGQDAVAEQVASTANVPINQWVHVMAIRTAGGGLYLYINGEQDGYVGSITTNYAGSGTINIGGSSSGYIHTGWISGLRIIIGDDTNTDALSVDEGIIDIEEMPTKVANTQLLTCKYQGTARNIGFEDTSRLNYIITENGDPTIGSFSPFSQDAGKWSNYFDAASRLRTTSSSISMASFCIECWVYYTGALNGYETLVDFSSAVNTYGIFIGISNTGVMNFTPNSTGAYGGNIGTVSSSFSGYENQWVHIAATYDGSTYRLFFNGQSVGTPLVSATTAANITVLTVGSRSDSGVSQPWLGYISNFRFVTGEAIYTSNFTPPIEPLEIYGSGTTRLLTCQNNYFIDNSSSPSTITPGGNTRVTPFSPFTKTSEYLPSTGAGSVYLDGNGDWLNLPNEPANFGDENEWCVEFWFWLNETGIGYQPLIHNQGTADQRGWIVYIETSGALSAAISNGSAWQTYAPNPNFTPPKNSWVHFAMARKDGTIACWVNGVRTDYDTGISTASMHDVTNGFKVGYYQYFPGGARDLNGYISGLKITKGASPRDIEDTTIDISTPVVRDKNTVLLMNFDNAGILDYTGKTILKNYYNTQVDTNVAKFNTGSLKFDGADDYSITQTLPEYSFGDGDFTMEMWVNGNATQPNDPSLLGNWTGSWAANNWSLHYRHNAVTAGKINFWMYNFSSTVPMLVSTTTTAADTWYHLALTRSGNTFRLFIDGVLEDEETSVTANTDAPGSSRYIIIGHLLSGASNSTAFRGYMDDLRITKGVARYTEAFDPPTKTFPVK